MTQTNRIVGSTLVAGALVLLAIRPQAQVPPPVPPSTQTPTPTPTVTPTPTPVVPATPADYTFASGAGLVFYYVKTARAADFETILGRLREALAKADSPMLKQQSLNWKIYKSAEPATDATVFVFAIDPAITTASYDPLLVLHQVLPNEVQPLYDRIKDAVIKIERMGLTKIR